MDRARDVPLQPAIEPLPGRAPRNGAAPPADAEELRLGALEDDRDVGRVLARAARDRREEVEHPRAPVAGGVDEHEAGAAGAGERALGRPRREAGRDAGVDGVPATFEDAGPIASNILRT